MLWLTRILECIFPRACAICESRLALAEVALCTTCLRRLPVTNTYRQPSDNIIYNLFRLQIPIERAAAYMRYMPESDNAAIVKRIKYNGESSLAVFFGKMIAEEFALAGFFDGIDCIVPVPITAKRRRQRGFNQAEMLSKGLSEVTEIPILAETVKRTHFKESQTRMNRLQRRENVENVFECMRPELLNNKHVLLVDDIITTGATLLSLANCILEKTDGVRFSVLSLGITHELALV